MLSKFNEANKPKTTVDQKSKGTKADRSKKISKK